MAPEIVAKAALLFLVVFLIASLMTNDVALWTAWSRLGGEEFYMVVAVVLYLHLFGCFFWSPSALALLLKASEKPGLVPPSIIAVEGHGLLQVHVQGH